MTSLGQRQREQAERLGELYEALAKLLAGVELGQVDAAARDAELVRLARLHGTKHVEWMLTVLKEDLEASR